MRGDSNYLFHRTDFFAVREGRLRQIEAKINEIEPNRLLNSSVEDLVTYFAESFKLDTPRLRRDEAVVDQREDRVQIYDVFAERPIEVTGTVVELVVPFDGDGEIFGVRPSTWSSMTPRAHVGAMELTIQVTGREMRPDQVKQELDQQLNLIDQHLGWLRADTTSFNASIPQLARTQIERRRAKVLADQSLVSNLGFNLKKRPDALRTYSAPIARKRIEPRMAPASAAPFRPEPTLAEAEYANILDIMNNMALVMERSPSAFTSIDEEDLRQHFLVQLNGQYDVLAQDI
jgi:hypothetical protein